MCIRDRSFYYIGLELCVRVREGQDNDFIERLKADSESQFRIGNIFISEIRSFKDIRRNYKQAWTNDIRNYVMGMGFLLLNIFLGLLGTFWFRTQQRRSEIALHKAHGATDRAIFSRLLSEGILLLSLIHILWARLSNSGWVLAELFLVFIVMWFLCDSLGCMKYTFYRPLGYDIDHVYRLTTVRGGESRDTTLLDADKYLNILKRLEQEPTVEAASLSYWSLPMSGANRCV